MHTATYEEIEVHVEGFGDVMITGTIEFPVIGDCEGYAVYGEVVSFEVFPVVLGRDGTEEYSDKPLSYIPTICKAPCVAAVLDRACPD